MVTVTGVEVTADLAGAGLRAAHRRTEAERARGPGGAEAAAPFLRGSWARLHVRRIPELRFQEDRSLEQAQRIEEILRDVLPDDDAEPEEDGSRRRRSRTGAEEEESPRRRAGAGAGRRAACGQAGGAHVPRRGGRGPAGAAGAAGRPHRHAGPLRVGAPASLRGAGHPPRRVPHRPGQDLRGHGPSGRATDTHDREGEVVSASEAWREVDRGRLEAALGPLRGDILQVPPRFSAKKVGGEAAHRRPAGARRCGYPAVPVTVHELTGRLEPPGRAPAGALLQRHLRPRPWPGTWGTRSGSGPTSRRCAAPRSAASGWRTPSPRRRWTTAARVAACWISPLEALAHLPRVEVDADGARALGHRQGRATPVRWPRAGRVGGGLHGGTLLAVARCARGRFRPRKVFPRE